MTKHIIADRLGYYDENGNYVTHRTLTRKPQVSFSKRVRRTWHSLNKPREFLFTPGKGFRAVLLLGLLGLGVLFVADQYLRFREAQANPYTVTARQSLWIDHVFSDNSLDEFNTILASVNSTGGGSPCANRCIRLDSNATFASLALSKQPIGVDPISGHQMEVRIAFGFAVRPDTFPDLGWGIYLTRNGTLPLTQGYNPRLDRNVALVLEARTTASGGAPASMNAFGWIQKNQLEEINTGNLGQVTGLGTLYLTRSGATIGTNVDYTTCGVTACGTNMNLLLNFTGSGLGLSVLEAHQTSGTGETTYEQLPWLQFQGSQYYVGYWQEATSTTLSMQFSANTGQSFGVFYSNPFVSATKNIPEQLDTGGFFGPIIKALIGLGVWILEGVSKYLGFIADVFVTAMNAVGSFFGLGAIGTAIRDALVGVATWVANVFGTIFGQGINIATAIANALSAAVQVTGTYWTRLTSWLSAMSDLLSLFWPFIAFFGVGLPFSALMTYWLIQGIIMSYNSRDGALQWMKWTWILTATLFNIIWAIGERAFDVILKTKQLLAQWL